MNLGICTRYGGCEAAMLAIRVADWATEAGADVSMISITSRPRQIGSVWDQAVRSPRSGGFIRWSENLTHILWTHDPHPEQVEWVRDEGKVAMQIPLWLEAPSPVTLSLMNYLLCPIGACHTAYGHLAAKSMHVPWDSGTPWYRKPDDYRITSPRVLLPLWDGNSRRTERTALDVVGRALCRITDVQFTVAYTPSTVTAATRRRLESLRRAFPGRFFLAKANQLTQRHLLFAQHDLTLWPTHLESTCLVGLSSLAMGTPVVGFSFCPTNEILTDDNSVAVPCRQEYLTFGDPQISPDYEALDAALWRVLQDRDYIRQLQTTVHSGLLSRRTMFAAMLSRAFNFRSTATA